MPSTANSPPGLAAAVAVLPVRVALALPGRQCPAGGTAKALGTTTDFGTDVNANANANANADTDGVPADD